MHLKPRLVVACALLAAASRAFAAPDHVDITWMSVTNMYFEIGDHRVLADGYITRLPKEEFSGGGGGLKVTRGPARSDVNAVRQVFEALGGKGAIDLLLTGHNHFDHAFDTATWAKLSGAHIVGSPTTCLQVQAQKVPAKFCRRVLGGEKLDLARGVAMYVIRWNHSGDPAKNPEQHNPVELKSAPIPDPVTGGLRAGVAEDFPNGGGNRAYLFTVDGPRGKFSWLFQDSASPVDLREPIVLDGKNYGAPLDNLRAALRLAGVESVDLWIATGGVPVAELVLPVAKPKAYLPVHWDDFSAPFLEGVTSPYADPALETMLKAAGVKMFKPLQYMDKWRLDAEGIRDMDNSAIKRKLGFR